MDAGKIQTLDDLIGLIGELRADLTQHPHGWENQTLQSFLEAMQAWMDDVRPQIDAEEQSLKSEWELFARILLAARIYE